MADTCLLEIAANSVASALAAQDGGADRIELCSALELGGLTPSRAQIVMARDRLRIPVYVLIRPRAGDFLYTDLECETMLRDIETSKAIGCDGVVIGVLDADGCIDQVRCRVLIAAAGKLGITFHRAFDLTRDPRQALEDAVALGCERILTSGAQTNAVAGADQISALITQAAGRIAVMPGAGIDEHNIAALRRATRACEFHASAKRILHSTMRHAAFAGSGMDAGELRSDVEHVRALVAALGAIG
ncbi:MAG: copper homeostasis protein CutC [Rudaea sp.]|nr:copper homeostasis protein CutC [Rudaea sp.]